VSRDDGPRPIRELMPVNLFAVFNERDVRDGRIAVLYTLVAAGG
jgi:hypothetical protein